MCLRTACAGNRNGRARQEASSGKANPEVAGRVVAELPAEPHGFVWPLACVGSRGYSSSGYPIISATFERLLQTLLERFEHGCLPNISPNIRFFSVPPIIVWQAPELS